jgi:Uma2 family endonuclease
MTLSEWAALPEDDAGELVDGLLEEEEMPDWVHETVVAWLLRTLGNWLAPRGGFVAGSEVKYAVRARRGRKPDASVFLPGARVPPGRGLVRIPPDLVVEVVSPTPRDARRDRVQKIRDYAAFGVRWYWILDPQVRTLEVFERGEDGRYAVARSASEGTLSRIPGCPRLELDLDDLWAQVDRLGADRR